MKSLLLGLILAVAVGCSPTPDPTPTPDPNPVPSAVAPEPSAPVVVVPADKTISSQPAVKCEPVKAQKKVAVVKAAKAKAKVKKHVKRHRTHKGVILAPKKGCDCHTVAPVPVAPGVVVAPKSTPAPAEKQPYEYWLKGTVEPKAVDPVGESEKDRCTRTGGWWNIAVPYCERQMP
jgi:hypothetical protein